MLPPATRSRLDKISNLMPLFRVQLIAYNALQFLCSNFGVGDYVADDRMPKFKTIAPLGL